MNKKRIVLTGGGTAGHVMPNLALVPDLKSAGFEILYVGSKGIESDLIRKAGIPFYQISSGKLRRYLSLENVFDVFRIVLGVLQAILILARLRPSVVFSKGGFVAVPVAVAATLLGIPVVSHESDYSPGLANRIIARFAKKLLYTFPETAKYLPRDKGLFVPSPIRRDLFEGDRQRGRDICSFQDNLPVLLVMGGSLGAQRLNDSLLSILPRLIEGFNVVHITGKGKSIAFHHARYCSFEFVGDDLKHIFAATDFVVCRAGSNSIFEMLALKIPMLLVPLELGSRGDQLLNANSFAKKGWADVLNETGMTPDALYQAILSLQAKKDAMRAAQDSANIRGGGKAIVQVLDQFSN